MAYLGKYETRTADFKVYTSSTATATHTLSWTPTSKQSLRITINGVVQQDDAFSLTGNTVTLDAAILSTDVLEIVGVNELGGQVLVPADGSIQTGKLGDNSVTLAKMAGGTDGNLITYDASGDPAYVATGTATHVLTSNGAGAAPTFQAAASKDNLPAFYASMTSGNQTIGDNSATLISLDNSVFDTASGLNVTASGTNPRSYTVQAGGAGKWCLIWSAWLQGSTSRTNKVSCALRKGGSTINEIIHQQTANDGFGQHSCAGVALAELIVGDYINLYATIDVNSGTPTIYTSGTWLQGFRLAE